MKYIESNRNVIRAVQMANQGYIDKAKIELETLQKTYSKNLFIKINLAQIAFLERDFNRCEALLDAVVESDDFNYKEFYQFATDLYVKISSFKKAVQCAETVLARDNDNEELLLLHAHACYEGRDYAKAAASLSRVIKLNESNVHARVLYANILSSNGEFDNAEKHYRFAIEKKPDYSDAYSGLSKCKRFSESDKHYLPRFKAALSCKQTKETESRIRYGLAKIYNDLNDYEQAFREAESANALKVSQMPFNAPQYKKHFDEIIHLFSTVDFNKVEPSSDKDEKPPILIIGLPRSGTTLVEQILSQDSRIYAGGEKQGLEYALWLTHGRQSYMDKTIDPSKSIYRQMSVLYNRYFSQFCNYKGDRVVDKVPANYIYLGLFKLMFPGIQVINMQRHPLDVATSIFFENFSTKLNYTNRFEDILFVYEEYLRLMAFWQEKMGKNILNVSYESLTNNYDKVKSEIVSFCGLELSTSEDFSQSNNSVETPSVWQVRQKIYKSSQQKWRRYENFIQKKVNVDYFENLFRSMNH